MRNIRKLKEPLDKYSAIMDLQVIHYLSSLVSQFQIYTGLVDKCNPFTGYKIIKPSIVTLATKFERDQLHNLRVSLLIMVCKLLLFLLQVRNERLFYKVLIDNVEELLPIVYTPIEGDACEDYSEIFHNPNGLFISLKDKYGSFFFFLR